MDRFKDMKKRIIKVNEVLDFSINEFKKEKGKSRPYRIHKRR